MYDCEVCGIKLNGETIREAHLKGAKHQKKLKAADLISIADQDPTIVRTDGNNLFSCSVCDVVLNSQLQLKAHLDGSKHQAKAAQAGVPKRTTESGLQMTSISISAEPVSATTSSASGADSALFCEQCDVQTNSTAQYQQHITSQKHLNKIRTSVPQAVQNKKFKSKPPYPYPSQHNPMYNGHEGLGYNNPAASYHSPHNYGGGYPRHRGGFNNGYNGGRFNAYGNRENMPSMGTFFPNGNGVAM